MPECDRFLGKCVRFCDIKFYVFVSPLPTTTHRSPPAVPTGLSQTRTLPGCYRPAPPAPSLCVRTPYTICRPGPWQSHPVNSPGARYHQPQALPSDPARKSTAASPPTLTDDDAALDATPP